MGEDDARDIGYIMVAGLGLVMVERLWSLRVRPWLGQYVNLDAGAGGDRLISLGPIRWTVVDAVGIGVGVALVLLIVSLVRAAVRRRVQQREATRSQRSAQKKVSVPPVEPDHEDDEEW